MIHQTNRAEQLFKLCKKNMTTAKFYIRNTKNDMNYDTNEGKFFKSSWEPVYEEDRGYLERLINENPEKFKNCVIEEKSMKTTYSVTFNYPNGNAYVIIETENLEEAVKVYQKTSPEDANHPDFTDASEIEVELNKVTEEVGITEWVENEAFEGSAKGWIIK